MKNYILENKFKIWLTCLFVLFLINFGFDFYEYRQEVNFWNIVLQHFFYDLITFNLSGLLFLFCSWICYKIS